MNNNLIINLYTHTTRKNEQKSFLMLFKHKTPFLFLVEVFKDSSQIKEELKTSFLSTQQEIFYFNPTQIYTPVYKGAWFKNTQAQKEQFLLTEDKNVEAIWQIYLNIKNKNIQILYI
ncbi:hypothetical protein [Mycoplasma sp. 3686d]|uniref:hypothetical protein n=1 Tax=Mycoplasma sp. 3686d TaxID=2967300 RepID=UPI00211BF4B1|nr:hypothetical protein [Mycoplasma sp. 3686d]UUM24570.1 hypothetical protein NPA12_02610 [Mycoplasma sp. 3686d]